MSLLFFPGRKREKGLIRALRVAQKRLEEQVQKSLLHNCSLNYRLHRSFLIHLCQNQPPSFPVGMPVLPQLLGPAKAVEEATPSELIPSLMVWSGSKDFIHFVVCRSSSASHLFELCLAIACSLCRLTSFLISPEPAKQSGRCDNIGGHSYSRTSMLGRSRTRGEEKALDVEKKGARLFSHEERSPCACGALAVYQHSLPLGFVGGEQGTSTRYGVEGKGGAKNKW